MGLLKALLGLFPIGTEEEQKENRIPRWTCECENGLVLIVYAHEKPTDIEMHDTYVNGRAQTLRVNGGWIESGYYDKEKNEIVADEYKEYDLIENRAAPRA